MHHPHPTDPAHDLGGLDFSTGTRSAYVIMMLVCIALVGLGSIALSVA